MELTNKEREVLTRLACGQESDEIAAAMGWSEDALTAALLRARTKLDARTVVQAVVRAAMRGCFVPMPIEEVRHA